MNAKAIAVHVVALCGLVGLTFVMMATSSWWPRYAPTELDGDPDGYVVAAVEAMLLVGPVMAVTYAVAVAVSASAWTRQAPP